MSCVSATHFVLSICCRLHGAIQWAQWHCPSLAFSGYRQNEETAVRPQWGAFTSARVSVVCSYWIFLWHGQKLSTETRTLQALNNQKVCRLYRHAFSYLKQEPGSLTLSKFCALASSPEFLVPESHAICATYILPRCRAGHCGSWRVRGGPAETY